MLECLRNGRTSKLARAICTICLSVTLPSPISAQADSNLDLCAPPQHISVGNDTPPAERSWTVSRLRLIGGFRTPYGYFKPGEAQSANWKTTPLHTMAYSDGAIAVTCSAAQATATMSGHARGNLLIEFEIPHILPAVQDPENWSRPVRILQGFSEWEGQPSHKFVITGLRHEAGRLIVGSYFRYDAAAKHRYGTGVLADAADLSTSAFSGWLDTPGQGSTGMGWVSPLPPSWQSLLRGTHVMGGGAGWSILSRHTMGPSAFTVKLRTLLKATERSPDRFTTAAELSVSNNFGGCA